MASLSLSSFTWRPSFATFSSPLRKPTQKFSTKMALNRITSATSLSSNNSRRKLPILLFDVMDTLVRDPFYEDVPAFFRRLWCVNFSKTKGPLIWKVTKNFHGLKNCMRRGYSYIEGVEELLCALKKNGYEIHAFTNYPIWYKMIEDKLKLSTYLSWTFCSCIFGKRKPDADFYLEVLKHLDVEPGNCIFIDDRMRNVEAAIEAGFRGLQFKGVDLLLNDLSILGIDISTNGHNGNQVLAESLE